MPNVCSIKMAHSRNPSVEVLRVLLMFLIVLYHSFYFGLYKGCNSWWTVLLTAAIAWHVDGFVAISGWFGIKFSWRKWIKLYGLILFYSIVDFLAWGRWHIACGWFGAAYLLLMFVAPFLEVGIQTLIAKPKREIGFYALLLAIATIVSWLPVSSLLGRDFMGIGVSSHSFVCVVFVYIAARLFRLARMNWDPGRILIWAVFAYFGMMLLLGGAAILVNMFMGRTWDVLSFSYGTQYNAPHVWILAIALINYVNELKVPWWIGNVCSFIAPSMFAVYIMHTNTYLFRNLITSCEECLMHKGVNGLVAIILTALSMFMLCVCVDLVRRFVVRMLMVVINGSALKRE